MVARVTVPPAPGDRRRDTLIEAAIRVIAAHGVDGMSLSRVAAEAKMSKPAVLYHLESRDKLVDLAITRVFDRIDEMIGPADTGGDPRADLFSFIERTLRVSWGDPVLLRAACAIRHRHPAQHARHRIASLQHLLTAGARSGRLDVSDPALTAQGIDGAMDAILLVGLAGGADLQTMIDETIGITDRIVTAR